MPGERLRGGHIAGAGLGFAGAALIISDGGAGSHQPEALPGYGLRPVGLAFYAWDIGVKRGYIQLLGTNSYTAPLLSTLFLVLTGTTLGQLGLALAALLITGGAALAARASFRLV